MWRVYCGPEGKRRLILERIWHGLPVWVIMFIATLSVKLKINSYVQIHRMAIEYWDLIAKGLDLRTISERQLRDRSKKISHQPGRPATFIFQMFPELEQ